jgi:hypothetical protein
LYEPETREHPTTGTCPPICNSALVIDEDHHSHIDHQLAWQLQQREERKQEKFQQHIQQQEMRQQHIRQQQMRQQHMRKQQKRKAKDSDSEECVIL